jgi:hypothetical protein
VWFEDVRVIGRLRRQKDVRFFEITKHTWMEKAPGRERTESERRTSSSTHHIQHFRREKSDTIAIKHFVLTSPSATSTLTNSASMFGTIGLVRDRKDMHRSLARQHRKLANKTTLSPPSSPKMPLATSPAKFFAWQHTSKA